MTILAFDNRLLYSTNYTDVGESFSAAQPLDNLSRMQLGEFVQFTGATAELDLAAVDGESPDPFDVDLVAVLGHTLPDGAVIKFLDDVTELAEITVASVRGRAQHAIAILPETVQLDTLTVEITNAGDGGRIGSVYAGPGFRKCFALNGFDVQPESFSDVSANKGVAYTNAAASIESQSIQYRGLTTAQARGPDWPNLRAIFRLAGTHTPIIAVESAADPHGGLYCLAESFMRFVPEGNGWWTGGLRVKEMA